jgi:hypothetical protein
VAQVTRRPNLQGGPTSKAAQLTRRPNLQGGPTYKVAQLTRRPNLQGVPTYEVSHTVDPVPLGLPIVLWMETKYYRVLWWVFCFLRMLNFLSKYNIKNYNLVWSKGFIQYDPNMIPIWSQYDPNMIPIFIPILDCGQIALIFTLRAWILQSIRPPFWEILLYITLKVLHKNPYLNLLKIKFIFLYAIRNWNDNFHKFFGKHNHSPLENLNWFKMFITNHWF